MVIPFYINLLLRFLNQLLVNKNLLKTITSKLIQLEMNIKIIWSLGFVIQYFTLRFLLRSVNLSACNWQLSLLSYNVYIKGKRSYEDISSSEDVDSDKTPTNEKVSDDGDVTPNENLNDITDMKNTLEQVKRAVKGENVGKNVIDDIKEEYSSYFDQESGNTTDKEALKEIKDYLEGELSTSLNKASLSGLSKALEEISSKSSNEHTEEPINKKAKTSETSEYNDKDSVPKADSSRNLPGKFIDDLPSSIDTGIGDD